MGTLPAQQFGQIGQGLLDHLLRVGLHVLEFAFEKGVIGRQVKMASVN
jgi:hypothetical protein